MPDSVVAIYKRLWNNFYYEGKLTPMHYWHDVGYHLHMYFPQNNHSIACLCTHIVYAIFSNWHLDLPVRHTRRCPAVNAIINNYSWHYNDVIIGVMASQITSLTSVYSTVYSGAYQSKHQSSASLAFVLWGIHRGPVNSRHHAVHSTASWTRSEGIWMGPDFPFPDGW